MKFESLDDLEIDVGVNTKGSIPSNIDIESSDGGSSFATESLSGHISQSTDFRLAMTEASSTKERLALLRSTVRAEEVVVCSSPGNTNSSTSIIKSGNKYIVHFNITDAIMSYQSGLQLCSFFYGLSSDDIVVLKAAGGWFNFTDVISEIGHLRGAISLSKAHIIYEAGHEMTLFEAAVAVCADEVRFGPMSAFKFFPINFGSDEYRGPVAFINAVWKTIFAKMVARGWVTEEEVEGLLGGDKKAAMFLAGEDLFTRIREQND